MQGVSREKTVYCDQKQIGFDQSNARLLWYLLYHTIAEDPSKNNGNRALPTVRGAHVHGILKFTKEFFHIVWKSGRTTIFVPQTWTVVVFVSVEVVGTSFRSTTFVHAADLKRIFIPPSLVWCVYGMRLRFDWKHRVEAVIKAKASPAFAVITPLCLERQQYKRDNGRGTI
eukprot:scaffold2192_cov170-Amphora_coffeaeformis.AAC.9